MNIENNTNININITTMFWNFLQKMVYLDYESFQKTEEYKYICYYTHQNYKMVVTIYDIKVESNDINELLEDIEMYYRIYDPYSDQHILVKDAVIKIYKNAELERSIDHLFDHFSI